MSPSGPIAFVAPDEMPLSCFVSTGGTPETYGEYTPSGYMNGLPMFYCSDTNLYVWARAIDFTYIISSVPGITGSAYWYARKMTYEIEGNTAWAWSKAFPAKDALGTVNFLLGNYVGEIAPTGWIDPEYDTSFMVADSSLYAVNDIIQVKDSAELMLVIGVDVRTPNELDVERGACGTTSEPLMNGDDVYKVGILT